MNGKSLLRPGWKRIFPQAWILSLVLFIILAGIRAYGLFGPVSARTWIMVSFTLMWFLPFIFFSKFGRGKMGIKRAKQPIWYFWGALLAAAGAFALFGIGYLLYGDSGDNWYVSVLHSWAIDPIMMQLPRFQLFLIYTIPAMLLSPLGEEFFFRGMVHESAKEQWGNKIATLVNTVAFSGIHLLHHGISWDGTGLHLRPVSGLLWFLLMMGFSWLMTQFRQRSGSIWPSVLSHAAFNLVMNITIFWVLI